MPDTIISDYQLDKECHDLARGIFDDVTADMARDETPDDYRDAMIDRAHETADGHQWVIYTHYALSICAHCNTDAGEELVDECGPPKPFSLASVASMVAYGEMRYRIERALDGMTEDWTDTRPEDPEADDSEA